MSHKAERKSNLTKCNGDFSDSQAFTGDPGESYLSSGAQPSLGIKPTQDPPKKT